MCEIRLYGHLGARWGRRFRMDVATPAEAVRALCSQLKGFRAYLLQHSEPGYRVLVDRESIGAGELHHPAGRATIKIVPVIAGAKSGWGQIILGAALIGFSVFSGGAGLGLMAAFEAGGLQFAGALAMGIGTSLALGGVSQLLTGNPAQPGGTGERPSNLASYAFNGAVNTTGQGNPVPILYGRLEIGSQVISAGLSAEQI